MKRVVNIIIVLILSIFIGSSIAMAEDIYYTNSNGISFTKKEYDFFTAMYYDGYQAYMTEDDMRYFENTEKDASLVEKVEYEPMETFNPGTISIMATSHETAAKKLTISKSNATYPTIAITAIWKQSPAVRSYDLIGAYLNGVTRVSSPSSKITYSGGTITPSATKFNGTGWGASLKLPNGGNSIVVSQTFSVTTGGRVYGSYQHAKSAISLNNSQSFTISHSGLGNVFYFSDANIRNKYDGMGGVYINV